MAATAATARTTRDPAGVEGGVGTGLAEVGAGTI